MNNDIALQYKRKIESGEIFKKTGKKRIPVGYEIIRLDETYLQEIMELQKLIINNLYNKDVLQFFSKEFMKEHVSEKGFIIGVISNGELVAFRNVYFPSPVDTEWNLGHDLGLCGEELKLVANLQMVCVRPEFRGNTLALRMNEIALDLISAFGEYIHICASVSPFNSWNLRILLKSGFSIMKLKNKYNGKLRYIVYQKLGKRHE